MESKKKSVLLLDDEKMFSTVVKRRLRLEGYTVVSLHEVEEAIQKVRLCHFNCIIADIKVGDASGEDLIHEIRSKKSGHNFKTPLIVISGYFDSELTNRLKDHAFAALVKPFELPKLIETIERACAIDNKNWKE